ncbi:hypothetical protein A7P98_00755 [Eikenella sp. NML080894]|nr:hypothetical protein A7P98_00755 [Eikenella sp. NML080894]OAM44647.1 hypothetical protein A7Q03_07455 [Eikenella sp. NML99-0057]
MRLQVDKITASLAVRLPTSSQCLRQRGSSKSQPLAYAQRSGLVVQADGGKLHGGLSQKPKLRYYSQTALDGE